MVKRVDKLTPEQEAQMPVWRDKWIDIGLKTGPADRPTFESSVRECYMAAGLPQPKAIIWVSSPIVGSFAAPYAQWILNNRMNKSGDTVGDTVGDAVDGAVGDAVRGAVGNAVRDAVGDTVRDAVRDTVGDTVRDAVRGAVGNAVRDAVRGAVGDAVDGAVGDTVGDAVRGAVGDAVDGAVGDTVGDAVRGAVGNAVRDAVGGAVGDAVRDTVGDAVRGAVGNAVRDAVGGAVGDAVRDTVGDAVGDTVRDAVDGAVGNAVRDAVDGAVDGAVGDAVRGAVGDAVRGAVGDAVDVLNYIRDKRWSYMGGQFWVGGWWGSPSYVSFFREICNLDFGEDMNRRADAYQNTSESACWWWPYNDFVMVCERPEVIHLEDGQLSSDHEMAIRWPDGWGLYLLDGIRFDKDEWQKIVNQTFTLEDLAESSMGADKSAVAIKYLKPDLLLKHCSAKLIHTGIKGTRLYEVKNFMNTSTTQYCMRMKHPTIDREYIEWVRPEIGKQGDADLAQCAAWTDKDGNPIPLEDYLNAVES